MREHRNMAIPRSLRIAEEVQRILGEVFLTKVQVQSAGILTVTHVEMTRDLRIAKVYVSFMNPTLPKEEVLKKLIDRRKEIRFHLGHELRAKYVPELRIYLDDSAERSARINAVIEELHRSETLPKQ